MKIFPLETYKSKYYCYMGKIVCLVVFLLDVDIRTYELRNIRTYGHVNLGQLGLIPIWFNYG